MTPATILVGLAIPLWAATEASDGVGPLVWGAVIAVAVVAVAAWVFVERRRRVARRNSAAGLFLELCYAHQLDRAERTLMQQVAKQQKLADPVRLFTEPQWLQQAQALGASSGPARQLATLRKRLFETAEA